MGGGDGVSDDAIRDLFRSVRTIAVVGASPNPARPSHDVMKFLAEKGFETYAVNPGQAAKMLLGRPAVARLADLPVAVDMVDVFRKSSAAGEVVDAALALPRLPKVIWMQLGVIDEAAAERARALGVIVVMDRCPKIEDRRLGLF